MIAFYVSSAPTCNIHAKIDEQHMLTNEGSTRTQLDKRNSNPSTSVVRYRPAERPNKQVDCHNAEH